MRFPRLFGCAHSRYTWPQGRGNACYVACLDCGAELRYSWERMSVLHTGILHRPRLLRSSTANGRSTKVTSGWFGSGVMSK